MHPDRDQTTLFIIHICQLPHGATFTACNQDPPEMDPPVLDDEEAG